MELGFREVIVATGEEVMMTTTTMPSHYRSNSSTSSSNSTREKGKKVNCTHTIMATSILNHEDTLEARGKEECLYGKTTKKEKDDENQETSDILSLSLSLSSSSTTCRECMKGTVYVSDGYENKQRLLVIVPYREAGIWSRSICMNQFDSDSDSGSMMSYLKKALSENYGIVIFNPAAQSCHPRAHVENAWDRLIAPLSSDVFIIAFSRGAQMVLHLLNYDNGLGVMQDRVKALALVEPSHYVSDSDSYFARRMLARRAVAWILNSKIDVGCKIPQGHTRHGCVCVSAGTVPSNVLGSSGAYALEMVKSSVFGSFAARGGEAAGITVNASKISACGICHRKLTMLNRRIPCSWCEVKYCSRCCEDKFVPAFGSWRVCSLCQSLPCLIDPRRKNRSAKNHTSPTAATQERCSVFIRPTADDDDPVCLGDFEIVKLVGRDWWALGVMVYEMIDGRTPFNAKTNRLIKERIVNVDLKFSPRFTEDAKDFVSKLLTKNEKKRLGSGERGFEQIKTHPWLKGLDWDSVDRKEALFEGQRALMEKHAKEYCTEDIFETYMNTVEVPIDTPASVKSSNGDLFNDFAFNYMDGPEEEQRDVPEPDEEGSGENPLSPVSASESTTERSSKPKPLSTTEDTMLDTFLSSNGSHFDLTQLRPHQATDFGVSGCSSLSSIGTDDENAEVVDQIDDELVMIKKVEKSTLMNEKRNPMSPSRTQPVSPFKQ
ncbi:unnamed protein product [Peronospora belbahrii]|uniref:Protein kinase domain-containing protein n=1 Tax=Peronospora belbahrii TaxID=622444 RepID=A0AAU9KZS9_9STRA|nr:unnamed protein product [Peronospora belbahrii]